MRSRRTTRGKGRVRHFGAERRGAVISQEIRTIQDSLDLKTEPDFRTTWIDGPIWLRLKSGVQVKETESTPASPSTMTDESVEDLGDLVLDSTPSAVKQAEEQSESAPTSAEPEAPSTGDTVDGPPSEDPTFRIGGLPAANKKLVAVSQNDPLNKAITLMLQYDYSQLPVMQGEREVKGVVTWKSIALGWR